MNTKESFITKEGLEKLKVELKELKGPRRTDVAKRIQIAKEMGDLSENAEYSEAKTEQGFIEGRILEIEEIIRNATVIAETNSKVTEVEIGCTITIKDDSETREYNIVGSNEADPAQGKISNESPLGQAFLGKKKGEIVEITVPQGTKRFEIVEIK